MRRIIDLPLPSTRREPAADLGGAARIVRRFVRRWVVAFRRVPRWASLMPASLMPAGDTALVGKVLRTTLLSAPGGDFALGPLRDPGALLLLVRLFLLRRRSRGERQTTANKRHRTERGGTR